MIEGKDREETIRLTSETLGISILDATFIYAIEHGEIPETGDDRIEGDMPEPEEDADA